ncbi:MAG TPA: FAD-dependent thymidylate synthase [Thermoleophilaceae bacterium]|nr:FAD-dependent thymidylate synthase [Thermoleophilaceae bacterium]
MDYPVETFTDEERALLAPHFTNLDRPVFALVNLPETVKGALFARYSRYQGTLRRLYLEEFVENASDGVRSGPDPIGGSESEGERARKLYERIFIGYGDDSVAQLGGAHIACEWVSNVMTKLLQRGRLAAYLEQSTRYMPYDVPIGDGLGYRYWRHPELGPEYEAAMDFLFESYSEALPRVEEWAADRFPRGEDEPEAAHARSIRAKALDLLRGLLPASSLSHVGIFASGQAYEQLLLRLFASPLPEARDYASQILEELKLVVPSFVARVERPDRGGEWISYLEEREQAGERWAARLGLDRATRDEETGPAVRLLSVQGSEEELLAALLFESASVSEDETRAALRNLPPDERATMLAELVGERENRRHRPGRGFEALRYRFEVVSDYGAFRDLQRHRLLTVQWQTLGPELGAGVPHELDEAGVGDLYRAGLERSREEYARIADAGRPELAHYALSLGYRIRYVLDMNAREAMHLIELRSGREGHPAYRAVAHALHAEIERVHPAVAATMTFVDRDTEPRLERILSEIRTHAKQIARA